MISDIKPYPSAEIFNNKHRRRSAGLTGRPSFCPKFIEESGYLYFLFHAVFISLDHLLDHLAAHGTGLTGGQVAVVALLQVHAHLLRCVFTSKNRLFSLLKNAKCKKEAKYEIKRIFGRNHSFTLVRYKGAMNILRMHLNF